MKNVQVYTSHDVFAFNDVEDVFGSEDRDITVIVNGQEHHFADVDSVSIHLCD